MPISNKKNVLCFVGAFLILNTLVSNSFVICSWKHHSQCGLKFTAIALSDNFGTTIAVALLIFVCFYFCFLLIDGILKRDADKLLTWLIGNATFNAFLLFDIATSQLAFGSLTTAVLVLIWSSVLVLYLEFQKNDELLLQNQLKIPDELKQDPFVVQLA